MKYSVTYSKLYKKDFKKLSELEKDLVDSIIEKLANDEVLEKKYKDHALKGKLKIFRECHIKPDLLLVYQKIEKELILNCVRINSHSEIF